MIELSETDKRILSTIRKNPNSKKTKIAESAKIAWSTATASIDRLIDKKIVSICNNELEKEKNTLHISNQYAFFLGVSIGTSHIKVCVLDFSFNFANKKFILGLLDTNSVFIRDFWEENGFYNPPSDNALWCADTPANGLLDVKQLINDLCVFAIELNKKINILTVGFSFPGHIDNKNNIIIKSTNLDFDLNYVGMNTLFTNEMLKQMNDNHIKIYFEHNAKASAIAEKCVGCLKYQDGNSAIVYLGTGLGIAFWLNGILYRGKSNSAGSQFGHIKINTTCKEKCSCGDSGCLEQAIREVFPSNSFVKEKTGKDLAIWLDENPQKKNELVHLLSLAILNISSILEIEVIVFSGKLGELYRSIENLFQEKMICFKQANIKILTSNLGEYSAAVGAAIGGYYSFTNEPLE